MPKTTEKPLRQLKEERTRNEILDAAEILFNEKGLNMVSVQDIADHALLSRVTLYNYFGTRDGIMYALVAQRMKEGNDRLTQLVESHLPSLDKLKKIVEVSFDASIKSPARYGILRKFLNFDNSQDQKLEYKFADYLDKDTLKFKNLKEVSVEERYLLEYLEQIWRYENTLQEIIVKSQDNGEIKKKHQPMELVYFIIMSLQGLTDQIATNTTPLEKYNIQPDMLRNLYIDMIFTTLTK